MEKNNYEKKISYIHKLLCYIFNQFELKSTLLIIKLDIIIAQNKFL